MNSNAASYDKVRADVDEVLNFEGLVSQGDDDRLQHLLLLYQSTKDKLKSAVDDTTLLHKQFTDSTKQFESYVVHVTGLSDEREKVAVELQAENNELKEKNEQLTLQLACYDDRETRDMLVQIGLEDIVDFPSREQIAFLLVERARLLDELVEVQELYGKTAKGHLVKGLSQENGYEDGTLMDRLSSDEEREMTLCKLKDLLDKVEDLETTNDVLKQRLKTLAPGEYAQLITAQCNGSPSAPAHSRPKMADFINRKAFVPPKDLQEATMRLAAAEEKATEAEFLRLALKEKMSQKHHDDTTNDEGSSASLLASPRAGVVGRDLQTALAAVESHLQQLLLNSSAGPTPSTNASGDEMAAERFAAVQTDFERVKSELVKMMDKYNTQYRKYADQKLAMKNKLHKVREGFRVERVKLTEEVERLENDLALMKVTLQKEMEYKENMERSHHSLLLEQRQLQSQLSELEDQIQQKGRELATLKAQLEFVESDKSDLNHRIDSLNRQKNSLEQLLRQSDRHGVNIKISSTSDGVEAFVNNAASTVNDTDSTSFGIQ